MAWTPPVAPTTATAITVSYATTNLVNNLKAIGDPWTSYVPTWSAGITAIGNAVVVAKSMQAGKFTVVEVKATMGSTTAFAAALITFTVPVPMAITTQFPLGPGMGLDFSAGLFYTVTPIPTGASTVAFFANATGGVTSTVPFTWATSDVLACTLVYEAA